MLRTCVCVVAIFCFTQVLHAQHKLEGFFPIEGGAVTINTTQGPIQARGLDLVATVGSLSSGSNAAPWMFFLTERNQSGLTRVTLGSLGSSPTLDGSVTLDVSATAGAVVEGFWGNGITPTPFPINGGDVPEPSPLASGLVGLFPYDGGPVTVLPRNGQTVRATGLSFEATSGSLSGGGSAAPFSTLDENTAAKWSVNSVAEVTIDGELTLDVAGSRGATILGNVSNGENALSFEVRRDAVEQSTDALKATYPAAGGPISLESTQGPVATRSLDIIRNRASGTLVAGGSPAPYASLDVTTEGRWSASSTTDVVIDGAVTLDVAANGNLGFGNSLTGNVFDGTTTKEFTISPVSEPGVPRLEGRIPDGGGKISISPTQGPIEASGVQFVASAGTLTQGDSPAPFAFFVGGSSQEVTLGVLGSTVTIDGLLTLDVAASADAQVDGIWGDGPNPVPFPVTFGTDGGGGTNPPSGELLGSYSFQGGPVSLHTRGGPVAVSSLELTATKGQVVGGTNAAPFEQVSTNTETTWAATSSSEVVIDGVVVLDVQAGENSVLAGTADGAEFLMNGIGAEALAAELLAVIPEGGGPITLVAPGGAVEATGLELNAEVGQLIAGDNAEPFTFFINSALNQIVLGTLGDPILVDKPVTLDIVASSDAVITGAFDERIGTLVSVSMPVQPIPEPASGLMAFLAVTGALLLRRRRLA